MGRKACIFCGESANSGEHLLPDWLRGVLPSKGAMVHYRAIKGTEERTWKRKPFTEQAWVVCRGCNHGWMSRLESEAKPILAPAIARERECAFDLREQWIAARWAVKTAFVFQAREPKLLAPVIDPYLLKVNFKPPQRVSVWIGSHYRALDDPLSAAYMEKPLTLVPDDEHFKEPAGFGWVAFLAVGGISFLIAGHRFGNYVEFALGQKGEHPAGELFTKIWPSCQRVVAWPPPLLMDRELLDLVLDTQTVPPGFDIRVFPGRYHEAPFRDVY